ncbi:MAG: hypothetical protein HPY66_0719 [Firmicutes bacterium]|nr:hypothetical protein [Bacillota bacterium]
MVKRILALAVVMLVVVPNLALASDLQDQMINFTLEETVNYALEHSPEIMLARIDKEKSSVLDKKADSAAEKILEYFTYDTAYLKYVKPLTTEIAYESSKKNEILKQNSIRYKVEKAFYDAIKASEEVRVKEDALEYMKEMQDTLKKKKEVGLAKNTDFTQAEIDVLEAELQLKSAINAKVYALEILKNVMGLSLETPLAIEYSFSNLPPFPEIIDSTLDDALEKAVQNRFEVFSAKSKLEIARESFELISCYLPSNTYDYRIIKSDYDSALIEFDEAVAGIELEVRYAYRKLDELWKTLALRKEALKLAEDNLSIMNKRFEAGLATSYDAVSALRVLNETRLRYIEDYHNYSISRLRFENALSLGPAY